jgi:hypothetical protein
MIISRFIFSQNFVSIFKGLFDHNTDPRVKVNGGSIGQLLLEYSNRSGEVIRAVLRIHTHDSQKLKDPIHNHGSPKNFKNHPIKLPIKIVAWFRV